MWKVATHVAKSCWTSQDNVWYLPLVALTAVAEESALDRSLFYRLTPEHSLCLLSHIGDDFIGNSFDVRLRECVASIGCKTTEMARDF